MPVTTPSLAPLFGSLPGGREFLFGAFAVLVVPVALGVLVGNDAREHADHPLAWGVATFVASISPLFVGGVAVTVLYFLSRDELGSVAPPTFSESDMDETDEVLGETLGAGPAGPPGGAAPESTADDDSTGGSDLAGEDEVEGQDSADEAADDAEESGGDPNESGDGKN